MPTYAVQSIANVGAPQKPQLGPLTGLKLAKRSRVLPVFRGQDKICALGRRVIAFQSLGGESTWLVPDSNPDSASNTHPDPVTARVALRARTDVTPGCFFRLSIACVPCGQTQIFVAAGNYDAGGIGGRVRVDVTWHDQASGTETRTQFVDLPPSPLPFGQAPADPWAAVRIVQIPLVAPASVVPVVDKALWTRHVGAEIAVSHIGGVRVIDAVLEEIPHSVAREHADDAGLWTSHLFGLVEPDGTPAQGMSHPWQTWSATDPRGGRLVLDVPEAQSLRIGPQLISWTNWNEDDATLAGPGIPALVTTSASFQRVPDLATTTWGADRPGWSLSAGAYARRLDECHEFWSTPSPDGSIPVMVHVYGGCGSATAGTLRLQSSAYSWIDVALTTTEGWHRAYGHLRCGMGPGDDTVCTAFIRRDSGIANVNVYAISVHHAGQYTPTI